MDLFISNFYRMQHPTSLTQSVCTHTVTGQPEAPGTTLEGQPGAQWQVLARSDMTKDTLYRVGLPVDLSTVLSVTEWGRASWATTQV